MVSNLDSRLTQPGDFSGWSRGGFSFVDQTDPYKFGVLTKVLTASLFSLVGFNASRQVNSTRLPVSELSDA